MIAGPPPSKPDPPPPLPRSRRMKPSLKFQLLMLCNGAEFSPPDRDWFGCEPAGVFFEYEIED